jgi:hypothetical protein
MSLGEVLHFGGEVLIVLSVIKSAGRKAFSMALESVSLLNLAAIGQPDVINAKDVRSIVSVRRKLAWESQNLTAVWPMQYGVVLYRDSS